MRGQTRDRESFREMLRDGLLDEQEVELDVPISQEKDSSSIFRSDYSPVDPDTEKKFSQVFAIMATGVSAKKGVPSQTPAHSSRITATYRKRLVSNTN